MGVAVIIDGSSYISLDLDDRHIEKIQAAHERSSASTSSRPTLPSATTPMYMA